MKEVQVMTTLNCPNIVRIHGVLLQPSTSLCGIVMEYMEHGSLNDLMKKVPNMPWSVKISFSSTSFL